MRSVNPESPSAVQIPRHLLEQIAAGRCIAFVGAGFSAPTVPAWKVLLQQLAERAKLDTDTSEWVEALISHGGNRDLEAAAQVLQTTMGPQFDIALADILSEEGAAERIKERLELLAGIPFDAILTTNFDLFLDGEVPGPNAYQRVLRDPPHRWWEPRFWDGTKGAPIVKLHGEVGPVGDAVVFTQRDYRERLYSSPAYMTFLRSLFATRTVLFIGVSFTDAYLNELRSEVLAMLDHDGGDEPVAYAILSDVEPHQVRYLRSHEGLGAISFNTSEGTDWSGFEEILRAIHDATNPRAQLGQAIADRTILWVDPESDDTVDGARLLASAAEDAGGSTRVLAVRNAEEALSALREHGADLVVLDWPVGEAVLTAMRAEDLRAPAIVFARSAREESVRRTALSLGATETIADWPDLFREIERVLGPA
jgi:CheY-like chemotaxis protein